MTTAEELFIKAVQSAMTGKFQPLDTVLDHFDEFEQLAIDNKMIPFLYSQVRDILQGDRRIIWKNTVMKMVMKTQSLIRGAKQYVQMLEVHKVRVIWLKGMHNAMHYREPQLRCMCDVDILIEEKMFSEALRCSIEAGYRVEQQHEQGGAVYSVTHEDGTYVELHLCIIQPNEFIHAHAFMDPWHDAQRIVELSEAGWFLCPRDLLIHTVVHFAKHLEHHGIGIRYLCDVASLFDAYRDEINWHEMLSLMERYGLGQFMTFLIQACKHLFAVELPSIPVNRGLSHAEVVFFIQYLVECGTYGRAKGKNQQTSEIRRTDGRTRSARVLQYAFEKSFPSYDVMVSKYKVLVSLPFLLPVCWSIRLLKALFCKSSDERLTFSQFIQAKREEKSEMGMFETLALRNVFPE